MWWQLLYDKLLAPHGCSAVCSPGSWKWYMNEQVQWSGIIWCKMPHEQPQAGYVCHMNTHTLFRINIYAVKQDGDGDHFEFMIITKYYMYFRIRKYCVKWISNAKYTSKSGITHRFCQKENKQYIFKNGGCGHLGFMCEQELKVEKNVRNYFLIRNSQRQ